MKFLNVTYFDSVEFDSPDSPGSGVKMNLSFVQRLDQLRSICNFPFKITSGYRTKEHNIKVGGEKDSAHLEGYAADIVINSSSARFKIINEAIKLGFNRIGIGDTFIHLDISPMSIKDVIWTYPSGTVR